MEVIKTFVRVRPPIASEVSHETCLKVPSIHDIHLSSEKYEIKCKYDYVFSEFASQEEIFEQISPLLDDVLLGYNSSIFAYGQTSAGKVTSSLFLFSLLKLTL
jgi:kinesin family member 15